MLSDPASWSEESLARLPRRGGFRLRGLEMTRLETFCDAAFAFAVTLLVIAVDRMPTSYAELITALKGVPAFALSFLSIAMLWMVHRTWSRRFGLEDGPSTVLSLALVFVILVYVYPLRLIFGAFFYWVSGGALPFDFRLAGPEQLAVIFVVYGVGFAIVNALYVLLYRHALGLRGLLALDEEELRLTRLEIRLNGILCVTALLSVLWAALLPPAWGIWAGFVYLSLIVSMPLAARHSLRQS